MKLMILVILLSLALGFTLLIMGSVGLVIAQSGLPAPGVKPNPVPNTTMVQPNSSQSNPPANILQALPRAPFQ